MANPITTVVDLNGSWVGNNVSGPFISVSGNAISIDMSAYQRPFAAGSVLTSSNITVTFGDDKTYTAKLNPATNPVSDEILWSNGSIWSRTPSPLTTLVDLDGHWVGAGNSTPVMNVSVTGRSISIDMPSGRPKARGYVLDFADIFVDFPDDAGYTGRLVFPGKIQWSNNSIWQSVPTVRDVKLQWQILGKQKILTVIGTGFASIPVTIRVTHNDPSSSLIMQFTAVVAADGTFKASEAIPCTNGGDLRVFVSGDPAMLAFLTTTVCPSIP